MEPTSTTTPGAQIVEAVAPVPTADERNWALFAHLGTLVLWVIAPIVVLFTKGKESAFVRHTLPAAYLDLLQSFSRGRTEMSAARHRDMMDLWYE